MIFNTCLLRNSTLFEREPMKQIPKPRHERLPAPIPQNAVFIKLWNLHVFTTIILKKKKYIYCLSIHNLVKHSFVKCSKDKVKIASLFQRYVTLPHHKYSVKATAEFTVQHIEANFAIKTKQPLLILYYIFLYRNNTLHHSTE